MVKQVNDHKDGVIFLCQYFYPEKVSSATLPTDTAVYLASRGVRVGCLCGYPKEYLDTDAAVDLTERYKGVDIRRIKYPSLKKSFLGRLVNYFGFTLKCLFNVKRLKEYEYVVVYSNPPILPYVAYKAHKKYGVKIIFVSYDVYPEIAVNTGSLSRNGLIACVMNAINEKIYSNVYKVVALSEDMKDFILANRKVDEDKVKVIPNWFEKILYNPPCNRGPFTVTYLGNMGTCQDMETLINAAADLKNDSSIRFVIGGQGNKAEWVRKFVAENGMANVEIYPFISGDDYEKIMNESNCFVVSLERNINGLCFPSKYYSYLAYGRPVLAISEANCLTYEIEKEQVGFSVDNGDSHGLSEIVKRLSETPLSEYDEMCERAHRLFLEKYTCEMSNESFLKML